MAIKRSFIGAPLSPPGFWGIPNINEMVGTLYEFNFMKDHASARKYEELFGVLCKLGLVNWSRIIINKSMFDSKVQDYVLQVWV